MPVYTSNLRDYLKPKSRYSGSVIALNLRFEMCMKILSGLSYLHERGFKHLDMKLTNILINIDSSTNEWDQENCVITDFGIGGKTERETQRAATAGFVSPEQTVGKGCQESDIYSTGKLMVFLFSSWSTAWGVLFQPFDDDEIVSRYQMAANEHPLFHDLRHLLTGMLNIDPSKRLSLKKVSDRLAALKPSLLRGKVFDSDELNELYNEDEGSKTAQIDFKLENEVLRPVRMLSTDITAFADQEDSLLCHSYATLSSFRHHLICHLVELKKFSNHTRQSKIDEIIQEMNAEDGIFSFNSMLFSFLKCVNPRSATNLKLQAAETKTVIDRFTKATLLEEAGWKRIYPIRMIFDELELNLDEYSMSCDKVHHPNSETVQNFQDAVFLPENQWKNNGLPILLTRALSKVHIFA